MCSYSPTGTITFSTFSYSWTGSTVTNNSYTASWSVSNSVTVPKTAYLYVGGDASNEYCNCTVGHVMFFPAFSTSDDQVIREFLAFGDPGIYELVVRVLKRFREDFEH